MYFDQMYSEEDFIKFELSLNNNERKAIAAWLGTWYENICHYQRTGEGDKDIVELERNFSSALNKAVPCRGTVYRGLSDRFPCLISQNYLRQLLHDETFVLDSHASASVLKEIGEEFTFTKPNDDERSLSILLQVYSKTGRYLKPFKHKAKDEGEVVLLRGSRYRRIFKERQADPKPNLEYWVMQVEEL